MFNSQMNFIGKKQRRMSLLTLCDGLVFLLLLWHDLGNLYRAHSLYLSCSLPLFCCDASHVVILQLDKPFVFLEYTHTHTHVHLCMSVVCIFLRVNLHTYFSHCCIFFKLVLPFSLLFLLLLFNTCSLDFVVVVFVIIARPPLLLLLLCRTYLIGFFTHTYIDYFRY